MNIFTAVHVLRIEMVGIKPKIWRRVQVPTLIGLADLHSVFQISLGWTDSHLHQFVVGDILIGEPNLEFDDDTIDENHVKLSHIARRSGVRFRYEYDFGDSWKHDVVVEEIKDSDAQGPPVCLAGANACPPEDCGGVSGYAKFLDAVGDPEHEEHDSWLQWAGGAFDPTAFNAQKVNRILKREFRGTSWM